MGEGDIIPKLCAKMNSQSMRVLGVSACNASVQDWRYYIAVASTVSAGEFQEYTISAFTSAVFPDEVSGISIQQLEQLILRLRVCRWPRCGGIPPPQP